MSELGAFKAQVEGFVQGIGFRYSAIRQARRLGLSGYVRNLPSGAVEVMAEGSRDSLQHFKSWLQKGPPGAVVRNLDIRELPYSGYYQDFSVEF